jgi:hypothetical protein
MKSTSLYSYLFRDAKSLGRNVFVCNVLGYIILWCNIIGYNDLGVYCPCDAMSLDCSAHGMQCAWDEISLDYLAHGMDVMPLDCNASGM